MAHFSNKNVLSEDSEFAWQTPGDKNPAPFRTLSPETGEKNSRKTKRLTPKNAAEKILKDVRAELARCTQFLKDLNDAHTLTAILENNISRDRLMDNNRNDPTYKAGNFDSSRYLAAQRNAYSMLLDDLKKQVAAQEKIVQYLTDSSALSSEDYASAKRDFQDASKSALTHKKTIINLKPQDFPYAAVRR